MDVEPPTCYLRCCNVRTWTLSVSVVNAVIWTLTMFAIIYSLVMSPGFVAFVGIIMCISIIYINIRLRSAVLKNDSYNIRIWLAVYLVLFILQISQVVKTIITLVSFQGNENEKNLLTLQLIGKAVHLLWLCGSSYPVYQYYEFVENGSKLPPPKG